MKLLRSERRKTRVLPSVAQIFSIPRRIWRGTKLLCWRFAEFCFGVFLIFFIPFAIGNFVLSTPRVQAYRDLHPDLPVCQEGLKAGWPDIANLGLGKVSQFEHAAAAAIDVTNDENALIDKDSIWATRLRCALQRHVIPSANKAPIDYYLSFLEFQENGDPYPLIWQGEKGDEPITGQKLQELLPPDYLMLEGKQQIDALAITQLDVLRHHLMKWDSNYVIVFAHGWRHDASIGDHNVADLRLYAAHAVRFLAQRCLAEGLYCNTKVTAVYVGWRGARVDENALRRTFGQYAGDLLGGFAAGATLFDRKPVSEQIAPGVISALRVLETDVLWRKGSPDDPPTNGFANKMIVFGHSLGGNLFATGLQDDLVKSVRLHKPGERLPSVLGNLVVLINPAAEAAKWTAIQREVWSRIPYYPNSVTDINVVGTGHEFFPPDQRPVVVSATAALTFPEGGLRGGDCEWIDMDIKDSFAAHRKGIERDLKSGAGLFRKEISYDWATHDLFPAFKFNFKPVAASLDRWVADMEGGESGGRRCDKSQPALLARLTAAPVLFLSRILRDFPFQNTNEELSHTIGNFDPLRPAGEVLVNKRTVPSAPFGTTHELFGVTGKPTAYASLGDTEINCPPANYWLSRARRMQQPHGTNWDTRILGAPVGEATGRIAQNAPALQFIHGFNLAGQEPITRGNDPFWNMRALDALSRHDGYRLSSFICAMNQLVMDDVTLTAK